MLKREDLIAEMRRMATFAREASEMEAEEKRIYLDECLRKFGWMDPAGWREVVTWVIDHHRTRSLPQIPEIQAAVNALFERGALKRKEGGVACSRCAGTGWEYLTGVVEKDMTPRTFCSPCRSCRPTQAQREKRDGIVWDESSYRTPAQQAELDFAEADAIQRKAAADRAEKERQKAAQKEAHQAAVVEQAKAPAAGGIEVSTLDLSPEELASLEEEELT